MAKNSLAGVLRQIRQLAAVQTSRELSDGALLERFVAAKDEAAFTVLVERHGPMISGGWGPAVRAAERGMNGHKKHKKTQKARKGVGTPWCANIRTKTRTLPGPFCVFVCFLWPFVLAPGSGGDALPGAGGGGGDPKTAAKIRDIPCSCFHGDADTVVLARLSREMIRALKDAGGRPLYHEYPGVGHDSTCWDRTYGMADLYEWLLLQKLK